MTAYEPKNIEVILYELKMGLYEPKMGLYGTIWAQMSLNEWKSAPMSLNHEPK